jgi:hypothetical protein
MASYRSASRVLCTLALLHAVSGCGADHPTMQLTATGLGFPLFKLVLTVATLPPPGGQPPPPPGTAPPPMGMGSVTFYRNPATNVFSTDPSGGPPGMALGGPSSMLLLLDLPAGTHGALTVKGIEYDGGMADPTMQATEGVCTKTVVNPGDLSPTLSLPLSMIPLGTEASIMCPTQ